MIRLRLDNGNAACPVLRDDSTHGVPAVDQGATVDFEVGVFYKDIPMDLTGWTGFRVQVRPSDALGVDVIDLVEPRIEVVARTLTRADWEAGTAHHLTLQMLDVETNFLLEDTVVKLYAVISATDPDGVARTLSKGWMHWVRDNNNDSASSDIGVSASEGIAGEDITSYTPVAKLNGLIYRYDAANLAHMFAFAGITRTAANAGNAVIVQAAGELSLTGWGLAAGQHYVAGAAGNLISATTSVEVFRKVIGYAVTSDVLKIIKDNNPIKIN